MIRYLVINTGYTGRTLEKFRLKSRFGGAKCPMFVWDKFWGMGLVTISQGGYSEEDLNRVKSCFENPDGLARLDFGNPDELDGGSVCFKFEEDEDFDPIGIVEQMIEFDYCACFFIDRPYGMDNPDYIENDDNSLEEDCLTLEKAHELGMRMIRNEDLKNFVLDGKQYYCGTLSEVRNIQGEGFELMYLAFDCESG